MVEEYFEELVLEEQGMFGCAERWDKILPLISDESARAGIRNALIQQDGDNALGVWEGIKDMYAQNSYRSADLTEIMLQFCYPRLDIHVSKGLNHLLKSPFCVHPKTGRVCVPLDPARVADFSPFDVPTVSQLAAELTEAAKAPAPSADEPSPMDVAAQSGRAYSLTSLKPYFGYFENVFLKSLLASIREIKQEAAIREGVIDF